MGRAKSVKRAERSGDQDADRWMPERVRQVFRQLCREDSDAVGVLEDGQCTYISSVVGRRVRVTFADGSRGTISCSGGCVLDDDMTAPAIHALRRAGLRVCRFRATPSTPRAQPTDGATPTTRVPTRVARAAARIADEHPDAWPVIIDGPDLWTGPRGRGGVGAWQHLEAADQGQIISAMNAIGRSPHVVRLERREAPPPPADANRWWEPPTIDQGRYDAALARQRALQFTGELIGRYGAKAVEQTLAVTASTLAAMREPPSPLRFCPRDGRAGA